MDVLDYSKHRKVQNRDSILIQTTGLNFFGKVNYNKKGKSAILHQNNFTKISMIVFDSSSCNPSPSEQMGYFHEFTRERMLLFS